MPKETFRGPIAQAHCLGEMQSTDNHIVVVDAPPGSDHHNHRDRVYPAHYAHGKRMKKVASALTGTGGGHWYRGGATGIARWQTLKPLGVCENLGRPHPTQESDLHWDEAISLSYLGIIHVASRAS